MDQRPVRQGPDVKAVEVARSESRGPHPDPSRRLVRMDARRARAQRSQARAFHHRVDDGGWFAFAGLRSRAHVEDVEGPLVTVAIITTDAAGPAARLHDRMPVVLADSETMQAWLSPELQLDDVPQLLAPIAGNRISVEPASALVNSVRNDGPELLELA